MKKTLTIAVIALVLLLPTQQVQSQSALILIELGDEWQYDVTEIGLVDFKVESYDYMGTETQVRINEINSTYLVDPTNLEELSREYPINAAYTDFTGSATVEVTYGEVYEDILYKTARGNIPYYRVMLVNTTLNFTNIDYNGTAINEYYTSINCSITITSSNPQIIETVATGTVQLNTKSVVVEGTITDDFMDAGYGVRDTNVQLIYSLVDRYEASDPYTFKTVECRNMSIEPISATLDTINFYDDNGYWWEFLHFMFPLYAGITEDWVYAYDVGLPFEIVQDLVAVELTAQGAKLSVVEDNYRKMELTDASLTNSDYKFTTKTLSPVTITVLSMMMLTAVVMYRRKAKK